MLRVECLWTLPSGDEWGWQARQRMRNRNKSDATTRDWGTELKSAQIQYGDQCLVWTPWAWVEHGS